MPDERVETLLKGAVDVHMHTGPDLFARSVTDLEAATQARDAGMKAIMIKSHHTLTADRAALASSLSGFKVFGGLVLNYYVGGFNLHAVETALRFGAREIWMPTTCARHYLQGSRSVVHFAPQLPDDVPGLVIQDDNGEILPEVVAILEKIAKHDAILGSGHLTAAETKALVKLAKQIGVKKILITHPEADFVGMTIEDMKEVADLGGIIELHYAMFTHSLSNPTSPAFTARAMREVGPDRCIMATDGGQAANPIPTEMLRRYITLMLEQGLTESEIRTMVAVNPSKILELD